ncbi:hypothetical protein GCM10028868_18230 [Virgibacillus kimchii]
MGWDGLSNNKLESIAKAGFEIAKAINRLAETQEEDNEETESQRKIGFIDRE